MERSPIPIYLLFPPYSGALERLRRRLAFESWAQEPASRKRAGKLAFSIAWPLVAAVRALSTTWRNREAFRQVFNKSAGRVLVYQWIAAVWYGLPPAAFLKNAGTLSRDLSAARLIITRQECVYLVNRLIMHLEKNDLKDKFRFFQRCRHARLPCIPVICRFSNGQIELVAQSAHTHNSIFSGLFAKPSADKKGRGAIAWRAVENGQFEGTNGEIQSLQQLSETLRERSATGSTYLLQPRIKNHDLINILSPGALATIRLFTVCSISGQVVPLLGCFRMATGSSVTDNFATGGLAAAIDLETGILDAATSKANVLKSARAHPNTSSTIQGRQLPNWPEAVKLALDAHSEFSEFFLVGWDIALTPNGPILVEGNQRPDMDMQFITRSPLGETCFVRLAEQRLAALASKQAA